MIYVNPALPIIRNIPYLPWFRVLKVKQDLYYQPYDHPLFAMACLTRPEKLKFSAPAQGQDYEGLRIKGLGFRV